MPRHLSPRHLDAFRRQLSNSFGAVDPDFDDEDAAIAHYREAVTQHGCLPADFAAITDLFELPR